MKRFDWRRLGGVSFLLLLWAGSGTLFLVQRGYSLAFLFYGLTVFIGYLVWVQLSCLRSVEMSRTIASSTLHTGQQLEVEIHIKQRSWMVLPWVWIKDEWTDVTRQTAYSSSHLIFPWFRSRMMLRYRINGLRRGVYRFERLEMTTGDLFGLLEKRKTIPVLNEWIVYPRPFEIQPGSFGIGGSAEIMTLSPIFSKMEQSPNGTVRDYTPGDPLRRIHWKSTARFDALKTREWGPMEAEEMTIILDASAHAYDSANGKALFERSLEVAVGMLMEADRRHFRMSLVCTGQNTTILPQTRCHLDSALLTLAALSPLGGRSFTAITRQLVQLHQPKGVVVYITPLLDADLLTCVDGLRLHQLQALVVYVHHDHNLSSETLLWQEKARAASSLVFNVGLLNSENKEQGGSRHANAAGA